MPGFVSHTVMARDVYNKLNDNSVNLDYMITYSLGGDLCKYAKCRYDSHHKDMDKFIYDMADYIKENNLIDNKEIMGVLYGHICHYVMDDTIHPLVRKVDRTCIKNKRNHTMIEVYYDNYLVNYKYHIIKKVYLKKGILITKNNKEINKMIDYTYHKTYNTANVSKYYKFNLFLYRMLRNIYLIIDNKIIEKITGLKNFLNKNKQVNLTNDDLKKLYNKSIDLAYEYIEKVNKYLKN